MPIVRVKTDKGNEVRFWVPEGTGMQGIQAMAPRAYELQERGIDVTKEAEWGRSIAGHIGTAIKAVPGGAVSGAGMAATGLAQLLPEGMEVPTRDFIGRATETLEGPFRPSPRYEDTVSAKFGHALGTTAPLIATGFYGAPGFAAGIGVGGAMGAGEAVRRAEGAGATEEQISEAARWGVIPGLGETLVPFAIGKGVKAARAAKTLQDAVGERQALSILDRARRAAIAGGEEGLQEVSAEVAQNLIAQNIYDPNTGTFSNTGEAFGLGAGVGGFLKTLADLALPGRSRSGTGGNNTGNEMLVLPPPPTQPPGALPPPAEEGIGQLISRPTQRPNTIGSNLPVRTTARDAGVSLEDLEAVAGPEPIEGRVVPEEIVRGDVEQGEMFDARGRPLPREEQFQRPPVIAAPAPEPTPEPEPELETTGVAVPTPEPVRESQRRAEPVPEPVEPAPQPAEPTTGEAPTTPASIPTTGEPAPAPAPEPRTEEAPPTPAPAPRIEEKPPTAMEQAMRSAYEEAGQEIPTAQPAENPDVIAPADEIAETAPLTRKVRDGITRSVEQRARLDVEGRATQPTDLRAVQELVDSAPTQNEQSPTPDASAAFYFDRYGVAGGLAVMAQEAQGVAAPETQVRKDIGKARIPATERDIVATQEDKIKPGETRIFRGERGDRKGKLGLMKRRAEAAMAWVRNNPNVSQEMKRTLAREEALQRSQVTDAVETQRRVTPQTEEDTVASRRAAQQERQEQELEETMDNIEAAREEVEPEQSTPAATQKAQPDNALPVPRALQRFAKAARNMAYGDATTGDILTRRGSNLAAAMAGVTPRNNLTQRDVNRLSAEMLTERGAFMDSRQLEAMELESQLELEESSADAAEKLFEYLDNPEVTPEKAKAALDTYKKLFNKKLALKSNAVAASSQPLPDTAYEAIQKGDLRAALEAVAKSENPLVARIAKVLTGVVGNTKVEIDTTLAVAGRFDTQTNTIKLNPAEGGNTVHALLHEMTHAATSHALAKGGKAVNKLRSIFEQVKRESPSYYGTQSLDEFVAEAWGNSEFQDMLNRMHYKAQPQSLLERFIEAVKDLFRSLGFFQAPGVTTGQAVDKLIMEIVSTAPRTRMAPPLNLNMFADPMYDMNRKLKQTFRPQQRLQNAIKEAQGITAHGLLDTISSFSSKWLLSAPLFSDFAKPILGEKLANRLPELIRAHSGEEMDATEASEAFARRLSRWIKSDSVTEEDIKNLSTVMGDSTLAEVDPTKPASNYSGRKLVTWKRLNKLLPNSARKLYSDMLKANNELYKLQIDSLFSYIDESVDAKTAKKLKNKLAEKVVNRRRIHPFFHLGRPHADKYWVTFNTYVDDALGDTKFDTVKVTFPTKRDAQDFIRDLQANPQEYSALELNQQMRDQMLGSIVQVDRLDLQKLRQQAPSTGFLNTLFDILDGVEGDIQEQVMEAVLDLTSEQSVLKAFHKRENVPGFGDMISSFVNNLAKMHRNTVNLRYAREFRNYEQELQSLISEGGAGHPEGIRARLQTVNPIEDLEGFKASEDIKPFEKAALLDLLDSLQKQGYTGAELQERYRNALVDYSNELGTKTNYIATEMMSRARYASAPKSSTVTTALKAVGFGWTLGFNVSSIVVNAVQVPMVTFPILAGRYGTMKAAAALKQSYKRYSTVLGMFRTEYDLSGEAVETNRTPPSLLNMVGDRALMGRLRKAVEDGESGLDLPITEEEVAMLEKLGKRLRKEGMLGHSVIEEQQELQEATPSLLHKVNNAMGKMFHTGERMNREVTMMAAFELEMSHPDNKNLPADQKFEKAVQQAMWMTEFTHGSAHMRARAKVAQSNVGNIAFMYKSYGVTMYYMMIKTVMDSFRAESPARRKEAQRQIAGVLFMSAMVSGAAGMPMYGIIEMIFNILKEDDDEDFKTLTRSYLGDMGTEGLINSVTNLSFSSRTSLSNLLYRASPVESQENRFYRIMEPLLGPVFGMISRADRTADLMEEGNFQRAFETALPAFMASPLRSYRFATEGAQTMRGDPIDEDINAWNVLGQFFGFAPADYLRQLEKNSAIKDVERAVVQEGSRLLNQYAMARKVRDYEKLAEIREKMRDYSRRNPEFRITPETINRSMAQRDRNSEQARAFNGIILDRRFLRRAEQMQEDFGL